MRKEKIGQKIKRENASKMTKITRKRNHSCMSGVSRWHNFWFIKMIKDDQNK